jgi:hypothetical protein
MSAGGPQSVEFDSYEGIGFGVGILADGQSHPHLRIQVGDTQHNLELTTAVNLGFDLLLYAGASEALAAVWDVLSETGFFTPRRRSVMRAALAQTSRMLAARQVNIATAILAHQCHVERERAEALITNFLETLIAEAEGDDDASDPDDLSAPGEPARERAGGGPGPVAAE